MSTRLIARALFAAIAALALAGCASMWKGMGVATEKSVAEREAAQATRIDELSAKVAHSEETAAEVARINGVLDQLKRAIDDLTVKVASTQEIAIEVDRIKALAAELQGRIDRLPRDTLKKLSDILERETAETPR
jgi:hypothetical protein